MAETFSKWQKTAIFLVSAELTGARIAVIAAFFLRSKNGTSRRFPDGSSQLPFRMFF
jgi:hypothetical protein